MRKLLVVLVVLLAAIVPLSVASARSFGKIGSDPKPAAKKPVKIQVKVDIGRSRNDRRHDSGGIKITLGSVKVTLGANDRDRYDRGRYDDRGRYNDRRYDDRSYGYRDERRESDFVRIPYCRPDDGLIPGRNSVQFRRNGIIVATYIVCQVSGNGVYGRLDRGNGCRIYPDDEQRIF